MLFVELFNQSDENFTRKLNFASMLQCWLTFGVLEAIFQKRIKLNYLTRETEHGVRLIDSRNLTFLLCTEAKQIELFPNYGRYKILPRIRSILYESDRVNNHFLDIFECFWDNITTNSNCQESKQVLEHIQEGFIIHGLFWEVLAYFHFNISHKLTETITASLYYHRDAMRRTLIETISPTGLCPRFIQCSVQLSYTICFWLLFWASRTKIPSIEDHGRCSAEQCKLDSSPKLERQHRAECVAHDCYVSRPSVAAVYEILDRGAIPLMQLRRDDNDKIWIKTIRCTREDLRRSDYVAFSHVWRHGYGSTTEEGLLQCQINFLWHIMTNLTKEAGLHDHIEFSVCLYVSCIQCGTSALPHLLLPTYHSKLSYLNPREIEYVKLTGLIQAPSYFWIDSLCVPSSLAHRRIAIQSINTAYRSTWAVFVIDKALTTIKIAERDDLELYTAVATCAWQTRHAD